MVGGNSANVTQRKSARLLALSECISPTERWKSKSEWGGCYVVRVDGWDVYWDVAVACAALGRFIARWPGSWKYLVDIWQLSMISADTPTPRLERFEMILQPHFRHLFLFILQGFQLFKNVPLDKARGRSGPRWLPHRQAWNKQSGHVKYTVVPCILKSKTHLGHLDHIGKLSQAGDGDDIVVCFLFGPGQVIK